MINDIDNYVNELNEQLKDNANFKCITVRHTIKDDKVAFKCNFTDVYDCRDKTTIITKVDDISNVKEVVGAWINNIIDGLKIVHELNDIISEHQKLHNCSIRIMYRFSYNDDDYVKIIDWDYDKIVVGLNKKSISNLITYWNGLNEIVNVDDYNCSIIKFISGFNDIRLHSVIGAKLVGDTISILKDNMLNREEILNMIENRTINRGTQRIKSIFSIRELGILAIFIWNIDFDIGLIGTTLMGDKILSIKEDRFIRDSDICKAVHSLYEIKANEINSIFKTV